MRIERAIETIARWLDNVCVADAPNRIAAAHEQNAASERAESAAERAPIRICAHEAAHGAVAAAMNFRPGPAAVRTDGSGSARFEDDGDDIFSSIVVGLAGVAAELMLLGTDEIQEFRLSHGSDILAARVSIDAYRANFPETSFRAFATAACCAVMSQARAIDRVAMALHEAGELEGEAIAALCRAPN